MVEVESADMGRAHRRPRPRATLRSLPYFEIWSRMTRIAVCSTTYSLWGQPGFVPSL